MKYRNSKRSSLLFSVAKIASVSLAFVCCTAAEYDKQEVSQQLTPKSFQVHSQNYSDVFSAECAPQGLNKVRCNFIGVTVIPPEPEDRDKRRELEKSLQSLDAQSQAKLKLQSSKQNRDTRESIGRVIDDPSTGPKTKQVLTRESDALVGSDLLAQWDSMTNAEQRTCKLHVQPFLLTFKRIGRKTWLSNNGPEGLCNVVTTYQLEGDAGYDLWTMTQNNVAVGNADLSLCKNVEKGGPPLVFSWKRGSPLGLELPCDFMSFDYVSPIPAH